VRQGKAEADLVITERLCERAKSSVVPAVKILDRWQVAGAALSKAPAARYPGLHLLAAQSPVPAVTRATSQLRPPTVDVEELLAELDAAGERARRARQSQFGG